MGIGSGLGQDGFVFLMSQNLFWRYLSSIFKQMNSIFFDASTGTRWRTLNILAGSFTHAAPATAKASKLSGTVNQN
jgi:hypothetical protein